MSDDYDMPEVSSEPWDTEGADPVQDLEDSNDQHEATRSPWGVAEMRKFYRWHLYRKAFREFAEKYADVRGLERPKDDKRLPE